MHEAVAVPGPAGRDRVAGPAAAVRCALRGGLHWSPLPALLLLLLLIVLRGCAVWKWFLRGPSARAWQASTQSTSDWRLLLPYCVLEM